MRSELRRASPKRLAAASALLAAYALWLFAGDSPYSRAAGAAGQRLPELRAGFPAGEPAAALGRIGAARADYLWLQAFDLVFVALVVIAAASAIAIAARRLDLHDRDGRFFLLAPAFYALFEVTENLLLALFAGGFLAPSPAPALVQQIATMGKFAAAILTALFAAAAASWWAAGDIFRLDKGAA